MNGNIDENNDEFDNDGRIGIGSVTSNLVGKTKCLAVFIMSMLSYGGSAGVRIFHVFHVIYPSFLIVN